MGVSLIRDRDLLREEVAQGTIELTKTIYISSVTSRNIKACDNFEFLFAVVST